MYPTRNGRGQFIVMDIPWFTCLLRKIHNHRIVDLTMQIYTKNNVDVKG